MAPNPGRAPAAPKVQETPSGPRFFAKIDGVSKEGKMFQSTSVYSHLSELAKKDVNIYMKGYKKGSLGLSADEHGNVAVNLGENKLFVRQEVGFMTQKAEKIEARIPDMKARILSATDLKEATVDAILKKVVIDGENGRKNISYKGLSDAEKEKLGDENLRTVQASIRSVLGAKESLSFRLPPKEVNSSLYIEPQPLVRRADTEKATIDPAHVWEEEGRQYAYVRRERSGDGYTEKSVANKNEASDNLDKYNIVGIATIKDEETGESRRGAIVVGEISRKFAKAENDTAELDTKKQQAIEDSPAGEELDIADIPF